MPLYRRLTYSDTWHWCKNCSNWPTNSFHSSATKPTYGELCNECKSKENAGDCSK